jgi:ABC-type bacteriocin/lantibiotic exporter with double-glycine peptidase domain
MPDPKTQRIVGWVAFAGVLAACAACGLIWQNQVQAAIIAVILADIILLPTFLYLIRTRRQTKKIVHKQEEAQQEQLDALAGVGDVVTKQEEKSP